MTGSNDGWRKDAELGIDKDSMDKLWWNQEIISLVSLDKSKNDWYFGWNGIGTLRKDWNIIMNYNAVREEWVDETSM